MRSAFAFGLIALGMLWAVGCQSGVKSARLSARDERARQDALHMIRASETMLAPVYPPLAEQIARDFSLAGKTGVGIDVGSGPGTLIVELCKHTELHWMNVDINPHFFGYFYDLAEKHGVEHRVSAVLADVHALPFRSDYADIIVSRGSYRFWKDKVKAFSEIYRVLKPGAVAYIGRGFSKNLPLETAREIRARQGKKMMYDFDEKASELRSVMERLGIAEYRIHNPAPQHDKEVNYGIWIKFRKPVNIISAEAASRYWHNCSEVVNGPSAESNA